MIIKWFELDRNLLDAIVEKISSHYAFIQFAEPFNSGDIHQKVQDLLNRMNDSENEKYIYAIDW